VLKCPYHPEGGPPSSGGKGECAPEHDPVEERLGEAEYHRVWCSAASFPLNDFRKVEFCGWVIGWGETVLEPRIETFQLEARPVVAAQPSVGAGQRSIGSGGNRGQCAAMYWSRIGLNRSSALLMALMTVRDEIVAPVIMSTSCGSPELARGFTPTRGACAPSN
jgi:hypothetical protein